VILVTSGGLMVSANVKVFVSEFDFKVSQLYQIHNLFVIPCTANRVFCVMGSCVV
jgi:hypothetical protein